MHTAQKKQQELIEQQQKLIQKLNPKQSDPVQPPTSAVSSQSPAPPPALTPVNETMVATQKISLRQHPDLRGTLLGFVESGQQVEVLAETDGWYQVASGLNLAYVPTDSLRELRCQWVKKEQLMTIRPKDLIFNSIYSPLNERRCLRAWKMALPDENKAAHGYIAKATQRYCGGHLDRPSRGMNYDIDSFPSREEDIDISHIKFSKRYPSGRLRRNYLCEITVPFRCTYKYKHDAPEGSKKICE